MSFNPSSGGGSGTVETVSGTAPITSDLDPVNPVISLAPISNANVSAGAAIEIGKLLDGGVIGMLPIAQGGTGAVWTTVYGGATLGEDGELRLIDGQAPLTKLADAAALSVVGRTANSVGAHADVAAVAASGAVLRESGSTIGWGTIATAGIDNDAVTFAKMQNATGYSVIGKATTGAGDNADIVAADETVLGRTGAGNLAFAALATGQIAANAVTNAKLATMPSLTVKLNATGGAAVPTDATMATLAGLLAGLVTPADTSKVLSSGTSTIAADTCRYVTRRYTIASGAHLVIASGGSFQIGA